MMDIYDLDDSDLAEMEREDLVRAIQESQKPCTWELCRNGFELTFCPNCGKRIIWGDKE